MSNAERAEIHNVEDLQIKRIQLSMIEAVHTDNARGFGKPLHGKNKNPNMDTFADLKESILERGLLQPLVVRPVDGGKFRLVSGFRRYAACTELKMTAVSCTIKEVDEYEGAMDNVIENIQRQDMSPAETGFGLLRIKKLAASRGIKLTNEDLAKRLSRSNSMIASYTRAAERLIPPIAAAWRGEGGLSISTMEAISFAAKEKEEQKIAWQLYLEELEDKTGENKDDGTKTKKPKKVKHAKREEIEEIFRELNRKTAEDYIEAVFVGGEWTEWKEFSDEALDAVRSFLGWVVGKTATFPLRYFEEEDDSDG